uniref:Peptidase S1 domain-containing protein n=1 Tax=Steinernema glaseri TaxID=37863 RepID=A0A1I7YL33_9BILA
MGIALLAAIVAISASSLATPLTSDLIYGGRKVDTSKFPFQLVLVAHGLGEDKAVVCGATLISPRYALTAAHCPGHDDGVRVYGGIYDINNLNGKGAQSSAIRKFYPHSGYYKNGEMAYNDIAIIELETEFHETDTVKFIKIDAPSLLPELSETELQIVGFGAVEYKDRKYVPTTRLHYAQVKYVDLPSCKMSILYPVGKGVCRVPSVALATIYWLSNTYVSVSQRPPGDSGGPLIYQRYVPQIGTKEWRQLGIVSHGTTPPKQLPNVFTRAASYCTWIEEVTKVACSNE